MHVPSTSMPDGLRVFRMIGLIGHFSIGHFSIGHFWTHAFQDGDRAVLRLDPECPAMPDLPRSEQ